MIKDKHKYSQQLRSDSIDGSQTVVVNTEFANVSTGIILGVAGSVTVEYPSEATQVFPLLAAGMIHPIRCKKITAVANGAADIVAVWN